MNLIEITDITAPELEVFTKCSEPQLFRYFEPELGIFVAESASVILRALEDGACVRGDRAVLGQRKA